MPFDVDLHAGLAAHARKIFCRTSSAQICADFASWTGKLYAIAPIHCRSPMPFDLDLWPENLRDYPASRA